MATRYAVRNMLFLNLPSRLRGTQRLTKKNVFHFNKIMRLTIIMPKAVKKIKAPSQPRSQGLSSNRPLGRARRDPGLVWSRATLTIENIREGSSVIRQFVALRPTLLRIVYIPAFI